MNLPRASGILLHPTSLPGRFGIGDLGPEAEAFLDYLVAAGQRWWQMLPLGPTGYGNSPYQSHSSYAGNPFLISPERLVEQGLLSKADLSAYPHLPDERVNYDAVAHAKGALLHRAFANFGEGPGEFPAFRSANAAWLDDYALYMAVKRAHAARAWNEWEADIAARRPEAMARWREQMADEVRYYQFEQFVFHGQWSRLRRACNEREIRLIGDLPIFTALDSADVWSRPDLFQLDEHGRPTHVAGVPPDYFSETGQLWGNPLYDWKVHALEGFRWWIDRLKGTTNRVDLVRLDHFRGFEAYWEVPADAPTAASGRWAIGPRAAFLDAVKEGLGGLPLIAEDLGKITFEVEALRDRFSLPGMRILQFAFGDDPKADDYLPYKYVRNCFVYTGTHDNDTTVGWYTSTAASTTQSPEVVAAERSFVRRFAGTDGSQIHWDLIRLALESVADTAVIPMQDILGLDGSARMNTPGVALGNWDWRLSAAGLEDHSARDTLADMTAAYGRWNGEVAERFRTPRRKEDVPIVAMGT